jgi:hypothetical protein
VTAGNGGSSAQSEAQRFAGVDARLAAGSNSAEVRARAMSRLGRRGENEGYACQQQDAAPEAAHAADPSVASIPPEHDGAVNST